MLSILPVRMALAIGCVFHSTSSARCRFAPRLDVGQQPLADDRPQAHGQLRPDVALGVLREQVGVAA